MKRLGKNLLSRKVSERGAQNQHLSKISLRLPKWFRWLTVIFLIFFLLSGYYPTFAIPPVKRSVVSANSLQEQRNEIISFFLSKPLILPHPGYLSNRFSSWHPGLDIATGLGMPIHSITDGKVLEVGHDIFGLGNFVVISHQDGFRSKYAHMGKIFVKAGQEVSSENTLGEVGLSGQTSGPHTHLEITHNGSYIDPQTILPEIPNMPQTSLATK